MVKVKVTGYKMGCAVWVPVLLLNVDACPSASSHYTWPVCRGGGDISRCLEIPDRSLFTHFATSVELRWRGYWRQRADKRLDNPPLR